MVQIEGSNGNFHFEKFINSEKDMGLSVLIPALSTLLLPKVNSARSNFVFEKVNAFLYVKDLFLWYVTLPIFLKLHLVPIVVLREHSAFKNQK